MNAIAGSHKTQTSGKEPAMYVIHTTNPIFQDAGARREQEVREHLHEQRLRNPDWWIEQPASGEAPEQIRTMRRRQWPRLAALLIGLRSATPGLRDRPRTLP